MTIKKQNTNKQNSKTKNSKTEKSSIKKFVIIGSIALAVIIIALLLLFSGGLGSKAKNLAKNLFGGKDKEANKEKKPIDINEKLDFGNPETFRDVYDDIILIDKKYQIDFKREALFGAMADKKLISSIKKDLLNLRKTIDPDGKIKTKDILKISPIDRTQKQLGLIFIDIRLKMIESQGSFHNAYKSGSKGIIGDGFYCHEEKVIMDSINSFNISAKAASDALYYMDEMLTDSKDVTWDLIGTDDNKILFYYSPRDLMFEQIKINKKILVEYCSEKRLMGKPKDRAYIDMQDAKFKDLFFEPRKVINARIWVILQELITPADLKKAGNRVQLPVKKDE